MPKQIVWYNFKHLWWIVAKKSLTKICQTIKDKNEVFIQQEDDIWLVQKWIPMYGIPTQRVCKNVKHLE